MFRNTKQDRRMYGKIGSHKYFKSNTFYESRQNIFSNIYAVQQDTQSISMTEFIQHLC